MGCAAAWAPASVEDYVLFVKVGSDKYVGKWQVTNICNSAPTLFYFGAITTGMAKGMKETMIVDAGQRDRRTSPGEAPLQASYESGIWKRVAKGGILDHTST